MLLTYWPNLHITDKQYPNKLNQAILGLVTENDLERQVDFPTQNPGSYYDHPSNVQDSLQTAVVNSQQWPWHHILYDTSLALAPPPPPPKPIILNLHVAKSTCGNKPTLKASSRTCMNTHTPLSCMTKTLHHPTPYSRCGWTKEKLYQIPEKRVPPKTTPPRHSNPWINTSIHRAIRLYFEGHSDHTRKKRRRQHLHSSPFRNQFGSSPHTTCSQLP